jgi:hypothetical protein
MVAFKAMLSFVFGGLLGLIAGFIPGVAVWIVVGIVT